MCIDGDQADHETLGNLSARQALCEQTQHINLTRCKPGTRRRRQDCYSMWGSESLLRCSCVFSVGEDVFKRYCSSLGPGNNKDLSPDEGSCCRNCSFIGGTFDRPDRSAHGFSQSFCRTPELGRSHRLSLCCKDAPHSFQADGNVQFAADLPG